MIYSAGFGEIMGTLARIGFFNAEANPILKNETRPTYRAFLLALLNPDTADLQEPIISEKWIANRIISLKLCRERETSLKTAKTIL